MKKTLLILACCLISHLAQAAEDSKYVEYWVPGVSRESGWKDVNKQMTEDDYEHEIYTGDSRLCWAAAASNVGAWWQDYNASHLVNYQDGIPQGEQNIFNAFNNAFINDGFHEYWGLRWFMDGAPEMYEPYDPAVPEDTPASWIMDPARTQNGGYYNGIVADLVSTSVVQGEMQIVMDEEYGLFVMDVLPLADFSDLLVNAVISGGVALGIVGEVPDEGPYGHAITLWGVKVNKDTNLIESMWVTDSDDLVTFEQDLELFELKCYPTKKTQEIYTGEEREYQVYSFEDTLPEGGKRWYAGADGYNEYIDSFAVLRANVQWTVPEPATGTLGLLALAGLAARRRRK